MSKDLTKALSRPINDASEAVQFLRDTFYVANLNLNPDLGFVKANNKSAFKKLTDEQAQLAQMRLVEAERFLREYDADIWEVCMDFSLVTAHMYNSALKAGKGLHTPEWLQILEQVHDDDVGVNQILMFKEESVERRKRRRSQFLMDAISRLHSKHPELQGAPMAVPLNGAKAVLICLSLLPEGAEKMIENACADLSGYQTDEIAFDRNTIKEEAAKALDNAVMKNNLDWDDDPSKGMSW